MLNYWRSNLALSPNRIFIRILLNRQCFPHFCTFVGFSFSLCTCLRLLRKTPSPKQKANVKLYKRYKIFVPFVRRKRHLTALSKCTCILADQGQCRPPRRKERPGFLHNLLPRCLRLVELFPSSLQLSVFDLPCLSHTRLYIVRGKLWRLLSRPLTALLSYPISETYPRETFNPCLYRNSSGMRHFLGELPSHNVASLVFSSSWAEPRLII